MFDIEIIRSSYHGKEATIFIVHTDERSTRCAVLRFVYCYLFFYEFFCFFLKVGVDCRIDLESLGDVDIFPVFGFEILFYIHYEVWVADIFAIFAKFELQSIVYDLVKSHAIDRAIFEHTRSDEVFSTDLILEDRVTRDS